MEDTDNYQLTSIAKKSVQGVFALISRTFVIQLLAFAANLILTIVFEPAIFGVYFIASSVMVFLNAFQDIGLAGSIIQRKETPTVQELQTVFTAQQLLVIVIIIPLLIFSKTIANFYNLGADGHMLLIALFISFVFSSLRSVPTALVERNLQFKKYVFPQIGESFVYYLLLILLALTGYGITSFTIAILARSVVGLLLTYIVAPWPIGIAFDTAALKRLAAYGLPFQGNAILALVKDDALTIYLGKVLPFMQMGYIGFAQRWAYYPLRLIMDNIIKITFPSYSRLQHDKKALRVGIEKALFLISFFIFPTAVGLILLSPYFLSFIPRYQKWEPALLSLSLFSLQTVFSSISTPLTNFLNAIGKVKITLYFMIFWTIATWVITYLFIRMFAFNGVAFAALLVSFSSIGVLVIARRYIFFSIGKPILRQLLAAILMGIFIFYTRWVIASVPMLLLEIILAGGLYITILFLTAGNELITTGRYIIKNVRK